MANEEHLALLRQGAAVWNAWREQQTSLHPDLDYADLSDRDLSRVDLSGAHLRGARLSSVNLAGANLQGVLAPSINLTHVNLTDALVSEANLRYSDFTDTDFTRATLTNTWLMDGIFRRVSMREANLTGADLTLADFYESDLSGANCSGALLDETNLRHAKLYRVNFTSAFLARADVTNAAMAWTNLTNVDLRFVVGLHTVHHSGPSSVGLDTISRSRGMLSEQFLRATGTPAVLLEIIGSLRSRTEQESSCILVCCEADRSFAERLQGDLHKHGVECWLAPDEWGMNDETRRHLDPCVQLYEKLLLVLSEQSVKYAGVEQEIFKATLREGYEGDGSPLVLFPICLDQKVVVNLPWWPKGRLHREKPLLTDFEQWQEPDDYQKALKRLLLDLTASSSMR